MTTTMQTDDALAFLCRGLCVEVGPSLSAALKPTLIEEGPLPPCCPATWLAKGCRLVTLIQTERGTRVYDQKEDFLYYASEAAQLRLKLREKEAAVRRLQVRPGPPPAVSRRRAAAARQPRQPPCPAPSPAAPEGIRPTRVPTAPSEIASQRAVDRALALRPPPLAATPTT
jgi:hypothetical protein